MQDLISAVQLLSKFVKDLHELGEKNRYAEVMKGIADMSIDLSKMTIMAANIKNENAALKEENNRLKAVAEIETEKRGKFLYDKNTGEGPLCLTALEMKKCS
jgi:hypothetical protein